MIEKNRKISLLKDIIAMCEEEIEELESKKSILDLEIDIEGDSALFDIDYNVLKNLWVVARTVPPETWNEYRKSHHDRSSYFTSLFGHLFGDDASLRVKLETYFNMFFLSKNEQKEIRRVREQYNKYMSKIKAQDSNNDAKVKNIKTIFGVDIKIDKNHLNALGLKSDTIEELWKIYSEAPISLWQGYYDREEDRGRIFSLVFGHLYDDKKEGERLKSYFDVFFLPKEVQEDIRKKGEEWKKFKERTKSDITIVIVPKDLVKYFDDAQIKVLKFAINEVKKHLSAEKGVTVFEVQSKESDEVKINDNIAATAHEVINIELNGLDKSSKIWSLLKEVGGGKDVKTHLWDIQKHGNMVIGVEKGDTKQEG